VFFIATENPAINASRIARRVMKGGHDVPITKVISRYAKSIINCASIAGEIDRLYVYDNSKDGCRAQPLFRLRDGKLGKQYIHDIPEWAKNILPEKLTIYHLSLTNRCLQLFCLFRGYDLPSC